MIGALNRDLSYNHFIIEQVAGDLLPQCTQDQVVATGFLRNSMINEEGGIDPEQFRMEAMFDRMDAIGKSILGLTIQCAQCHSHKYDPLTQEEYYRMFAFINNTHEANIAVYTPPEQMKRAEIFRKTREIEAGLQHEHPDWPDRMHAWEETVVKAVLPWEIVRTEVIANNDSGEKHDLLEDGSILASGYAPTLHTSEFTALKPVRTVAAVRLELLNDPSLPLQGPGRSSKGLFALTEMHLEAAPADKPDQRKDVKIVRATADVNPPERVLEPIFDDRSGRRRVTGPIAYAIDGKGETAWGIDAGPGRRNVPRNAVFVLEKPVSFPAGVILTFKLILKHGGWNSDDNQNRTWAGSASPSPTGPTPRPTKFRPRSARSWPSPARSDLPPRKTRSSATGVPPGPSGSPPTTRSRRSGSSTPRAHRSSCCRIAISLVRRISSSAETSSSRASW